jgi:hypothetical protein
LAQFFGFGFQGEPRVITTRQVIALRPRRPTLTFLASRQLFDPAVEFFDVAVATHKTIDLVVQTQVKKLQRIMRD